MRDYGIITPQFWTGTTGRQIRELGSDARVVAAYLLTSPHANMLGLYHLPLAYLVTETGVSSEGALKALAGLSDLGFAEYDEGEETVWVPEMARFQIADELQPKDHRCKGVLKKLATFRKSRFYAPFLDRYRVAFHLDGAPPPEPQAQGASKGLPRPSQAPMKPGSDQDQDQSRSMGASAPAEGASSRPAQRDRIPAPTPIRSSPTDVLAAFREGLADRLAITSMNPLPLARAERARGMRKDIERLGLEHAVELCAEKVTASGKAPPRFADYFVEFLAEQEAPIDRGAGENPKPGDPDFNDPSAWRDYGEYLNRTDGKTWEEATGLKRPPPYVPPKTPEEEEAARRAAAGGSKA